MDPTSLASMALTGSGAAAGYLGAKEKQQQQADYNKYMAKANAYSPWTGVQNQLSFQPVSPVASGFSGGLSGLAAVQSLSGSPEQSPDNGQQNQVGGGMTMNTRTPNLYQTPGPARSPWALDPDQYRYS